MSELELRETLSSKTVDVLVEIIVMLLGIVSELEMKAQISEENKKYVNNNRADIFYRVAIWKKYFALCVIFCQIGLGLW